MSPAEAAEVLDRKDEQLATFRCHGLPATEAPYTLPKMQQIAAIAEEARVRIRQGDGRGTIDDMLLQIAVLAGGV